MATKFMGGLPSVRRQHLLTEFAGLKHACPEGVFVSLTPNDPNLWSAVVFIRDGPYKPAVLRFQISFPDAYPRLPPLVTFSTDMFHPLITPLTTYMYTTDIQVGGTVSATDEERLPPGGFSLRHGFPQWFGRKGKGDQVADMVSPETATPAYMVAGKQSPSVYEILKYVRSTFDDEEVLGSVPLAAAGNPGAWHAWRTQRRKLGKTTDTEDDEIQPPTPGSTLTGKRPGEWNWEGVWEDRVKKGIASSLSEPVLYGGSTATEELIRFAPMDESDVEHIRQTMRQTLGSPA